MYRCLGGIELIVSTQCVVNMFTQSIQGRKANNMVHVRCTASEISKKTNKEIGLSTGHSLTPLLSSTAMHCCNPLAAALKYFLFPSCFLGMRDLSSNSLSFSDTESELHEQTILAVAAACLIAFSPNCKCPESQAFFPPQ